MRMSVKQGACIFLKPEKLVIQLSSDLKHIYADQSKLGEACALFESSQGNESGYLINGAA